MIISLSQKAQGSTWIETFFYGVFDKYMDYLSTWAVKDEHIYNFTTVADWR
jgi:hypothetical protein